MQQKMDTLDMNLWVVVLAVQAIPYAATVLMTLISALPQRRESVFADSSAAGSAVEN